MFESKTVPLLDRVANVRGGYVSRITDLTKQLGIAQAEVKNKEEIIGRLQDNYKALEDDKNILMDRLEQSQNTITQLGRDKGNLAIEVEQLRIQVETLKQGNQQGGITADSTLKQFVEWVKNLFWKN